MPAVHVVGAGLAGLSAAVHLAAAGHPVELYEASGHAGGRCRSYHDPVLDRWIDNGNHLVLSGNRDVAGYLALTGAGEVLTGPERAELAFFDQETGEHWVIEPDPGRIPWWILSSRRRVPGTGVREYLRGLRLVLSSGSTTVAACLDGPGRLYRRFWEPLAVAVLNAEPHEAAAALLKPVFAETLGRGEAACRPRIARRGLSDAFVAPALAMLHRAGGRLHTRRRLRALDIAGPRVCGLRFASGPAVAIAENAAVILALPPRMAAGLLPGLTVPEGERAILNVHYRLSAAVARPVMIGLIGGLAQWLFVRDDVASVTVSAADRLIGRKDRDLAARIWPEVCRALDLETAPLPPHRVICERRATFAQVPGNLVRRPPARTPLANLVLAGDWTATGLPATVEGALRSGRRAAEVVLTVLTDR